MRRGFDELLLPLKQVQSVADRLLLNAGFAMQLPPTGIQAMSLPKSLMAALDD